MTYSELFDDGPFPVRKDDIPEVDVQSRCVEYARRHAAWARKFSSPANRSVPDYVFCWEGLVWFVEFKRHGKLPTRQQYDEHVKIRDARGVVWVCDDIDEFKGRFDDVRREGVVFHAGKDLREP